MKKNNRIVFGMPAVGRVRTGKNGGGYHSPSISKRNDSANRNRGENDDHHCCLQAGRKL